MAQNTWVSRVNDNAGYVGAYGCWGGAEGIDRFAVTCRHEERHRLDLRELFGVNTNRTSVTDADVDFLPNAVEANLIDGHRYDPADVDTFVDAYNYGPPNSYIMDCEDYALYPCRAEPWSIGQGDSEDWAMPGHQWE